MFLNRVIEKNARLVNYALELVGRGDIKPDTYVIDVDTLLENSVKILKTAQQSGIDLYFMTKQIGRNPYISKKLMAAGYRGAVCVDYKEALQMIKNDIKIGHVGHLVQIPRNMIERIISADPEIVTVYTVQKAKEISQAAVRLGKHVNLMLRVIGEADYFYDAQIGGFQLKTLKEDALEIMKLEGVTISGVTSFPCFIFDGDKGQVIPTPNAQTLIEAKRVLEALGNHIWQVNMPSNTSVGSIPLIKTSGGNFAEPGHGLTGTVYEQSVRDIEEVPAVVYVSEISHQSHEKSWFYGGGHYRRSHMQNALVGETIEESSICRVTPPKPESIDYHFELESAFEVSTPVLCAFRTQVFVTRSEVALVEGLLEGQPRLVGIYDSSGNEL